MRSKRLQLSSHMRLALDLVGVTKIRVAPVEIVTGLVHPIRLPSVQAPPVNPLKMTLDLLFKGATRQLIPTLMTLARITIEPIGNLTKVPDIQAVDM